MADNGANQKLPADKFLIIFTACLVKSGGVFAALDYQFDGCRVHRSYWKKDFFGLRERDLDSSRKEKRRNLSVPAG
jgi:hypothetical protein